MTTASAAPHAAKPRKKSPKHPTWEHPKGSGIKIAEMPNKTGGKVYGVSYQVRIPSELLGIPSKREMHQRKTKEEAERLAEERFVALKKHGTTFAEIPAAAQKQMGIAWSVLDEHNKHLRRTAQEKNGGQLPQDFAKHELNIIDAVKAGIAALSPVGGLRTFAEVAAELRASKLERFNAGGLDASTESDFRRRSERLERLGMGDLLVSQITARDVENLLQKLRKTLGQRSVLNFRNTLAEILRYAKAKQYSPTNPLESFTREDLKKHGGEKAERKLDGSAIAQPNNGVAATRFR